MFKSWRVGKLAGFPIEINLSFLILLAVVFIAFGGLTGVMIVGLAFASVLVHELGHALVARHLGVHVSGIELGFLGGAAKMVDMPRRPDHEIAIAAAGPAVSIGIAGVGLGLGMVAGSSLLLTIGWINLVLAGFNLIPALPMDGGRILRAALAKRMSFVRATDLSVTVARYVAVAFGILGLVGGLPWLLLLAPFLWIMGTREKMMARVVEDHFGGYPDAPDRGGVEVLGRDAWDRRGAAPRPGGGFPFGGFPFGGGPIRRGGGQIRRFTISQRGGRLVIESLD